MSKTYAQDTALRLAAQKHLSADQCSADQCREREREREVESRERHRLRNRETERQREKEVEVRVERQSRAEQSREVQRLTCRAGSSPRLRSCASFLITRRFSWWSSFSFIMLDSFLIGHFTSWWISRITS